MKSLRRSDLLYPELSYRIMGCAFEVHNVIGGGQHEKVYERALAKAFADAGLHFQEQLYCPILFKGEIIGTRYLDFLVEGKIIVELKKGNRYSKAHIDQLRAYLKLNNIKLGLIINFADDTVDSKRILT